MFTYIEAMFWETLAYPSPASELINTIAVSALLAASAAAVGSSVVLVMIVVPSWAACFWIASRGLTRYCGR